MRRALLCLALIACARGPASGRFCNDKGFCYVLDFEKRTATFDLAGGPRVLELRALDAKTWIFDSPLAEGEKVEIALADADTLRIGPAGGQGDPKEFRRR